MTPKEFNDAEETVADKDAPTDLRILSALRLVLEEIRELKTEIASWPEIGT